MAEKLEHKEVVTLEELTLSNTYQLEALINVLERKGYLTKAEVIEEIRKLHLAK
jgi:hypothetical protein